MRFFENIAKHGSVLYKLTLQYNIIVPILIVTVVHEIHFAHVLYHM